MKRPNKKMMIELEELVGRDNFKALTRKYGGTFIYIPRIYKYDKRVEYLKNVHYMRDYLEYGVPVDEIACGGRSVLRKEYGKHSASDRSGGICGAVGAV